MAPALKKSKNQERMIELTRRQISVLSLALDIAHSAALDRGNQNLAASIEDVARLLPRNEAITMILQSDDELLRWVFGILHREPNRSGDFLMHLAEAAARADDESYSAMRPAMLIISNRFPEYECKCAAYRPRTADA
jgi:hypothetical protein